MVDDHLSSLSTTWLHQVPTSLSKTYNSGGIKSTPEVDTFSEYAGDARRSSVSWATPPFALIPHNYRLMDVTYQQFYTIGENFYPGIRRQSRNFLGRPSDSDLRMIYRRFLHGTWQNEARVWSARACAGSRRKIANQVYPQNSVPLILCNDALHMQRRRDFDVRFRVQETDNVAYEKTRFCRAILAGDRCVRRTREINYLAVAAGIDEDSWPHRCICRQRQMI